MEFIVLNKTSGNPLVTQRPPVNGDLVFVVKKDAEGNETRRSKKTYDASQYVEPLDSAIEVILESVNGAIKHDTELTRITCYEQEDLLLSGKLAVTDRTVSLDLRRDDGRLFPFEAKIINGEFSVTVNFPTVGKFTYSNAEANTDLPDGTFKTKTIRINVQRKAT